MMVVASATLLLLLRYTIQTRCMYVFFAMATTSNDGSTTTAADDDGSYSCQSWCNGGFVIAVIFLPPTYYRLMDNDGETLELQEK